MCVCVGRVSQVSRGATVLLSWTTPCSCSVYEAVSLGNVAAVIKTGAAAPSWTCCSRPQEATGNPAAHALSNGQKKKSRWSSARSWASSHSIFNLGNVSSLWLVLVATCTRIHPDKNLTRLTSGYVCKHRFRRSCDSWIGLLLPVREWSEQLSP